MAKFLSILEGDFINDKDFKLDSPLIFQSDVAKRNIEVPAGFVTDFASLQFGMFRLYIARSAAVVHDYGYRTKGVMSKRLADRVFLEAMKASGINFRRRWTLYLGVVLFGRSSYNGGI